MAWKDQQAFIDALEMAGELVRIKTYVDPHLEIAEISCDGRDLRVALKAEVDLPFQLPFLNIRSVTLISSATTYNQRNNGFYLFGFRVS